MAGDRIKVERKYGQPYSMIPTARLLFSANQLPTAWDTSYAFYRRWVIIPFPNKFEGKEKDKELLDKITTPRALSQLLNRALTGYQRLKTQGHFSEIKASTSALEDYRRLNEPVRAFIQECCTIGNDLWVPRTVLLEAYKEHTGHKRGTARWVYAEVRRILGDRVRESKRAREGENHRKECFVGIGLREEEEEDNDSIEY